MVINGTIMRYLYLVLLLYSLNTAADTLKFAFADDEPPISSAYEEAVVGTIPDALALVFDLLPQHSASKIAAPWPRAQLMVQSGVVDGFLTYPSTIRQTYALFTEHPAYFLDFGYLIYHRDNENRTQIEAARRFEDLKGLKFISQNGVEWERDNVPAYLERVMVNDLNTMVHLLLNRRAGDYFIMPPEQAIYIATKFGYRDLLAYQRVQFIPDSVIPFHVGIRKSYPNAEAIIMAIDGVLASQQFKTERQKIVDRYR